MHLSCIEIVLFLGPELWRFHLGVIKSFHKGLLVLMLFLCNVMLSKLVPSKLKLFVHVSMACRLPVENHSF